MTDEEMLEVATEWAKQNVQPGWIAETLHLPMVQAIIPILADFGQYLTGVSTK
jgi:hypothetical protein